MKSLGVREPVISYDDLKVTFLKSKFVIRLETCLIYIHSDMKDMTIILMLPLLGWVCEKASIWVCWECRFARSIRYDYEIKKKKIILQKISFWTKKSSWNYIFFSECCSSTSCQHWRPTKKGLTSNTTSSYRRWIKHEFFFTVPLLQVASGRAVNSKILGTFVPNAKTKVCSDDFD